MDKDSVTSGIVTRFFEAFDMLIANGAINSVNGFCREYGIDKRNLYRFRKEPLRKFYIYMIFVLVVDYGVNANWLVSGTGQMFKKHIKDLS
jgi:hypothetical protein